MFALIRARPPGDHAVLVWNNKTAAVAAAHSVDPDRWWTAFGAVMDRMAPRFAATSRCGTPAG